MSATSPTARAEDDPMFVAQRNLQYGEGWSFDPDRLDVRALQFDPDTEYRRTVKRRLTEKDAAA